MESPELSISVGELIGVPRVTLRGAMASWHDEAVGGVLTALRDQATTSLVLDIANLEFVGVDGASALIRVLRSIGPEMCVHVVASGAPVRILARAEFGPCIKLYSSTDEIAEYLSPSDYPLTSRWMAQEADDTQLPLAA